MKRKNQYEDVEIRAEAERLIRNHTFEKTKNFKKELDKNRFCGIINKLSAARLMVLQDLEN